MNPGRKITSSLLKYNRNLQYKQKLQFKAFESTLLMFGLVSTLGFGLTFLYKK